MTERPLPRATPGSPRHSEPGERLRRLHQRRRLLREEMLALLILLLALAITVAVLANQWLGSPSPTGLGISSHIHTALRLLGGST
jgi:hypothetical protein